LARVVWQDDAFAPLCLIQRQESRYPTAQTCEKVTRNRSFLVFVITAKIYVITNKPW